MCGVRSVVLIGVLARTDPPGVGVREIGKTSLLLRLLRDNRLVIFLGVVGNGPPRCIWVRGIQPLWFVFRRIKISEPSYVHDPTLPYQRWHASRSHCATWSAGRSGRPPRSRDRAPVTFLTPP